MTWVLDTNTLIYFFTGRGDVAETMLSVPPAEVAVPAIVVYELEVGILKSRDPEKRTEQLNAILDASRVLPFDRSCARAAAEIRAELERDGAPIGPVDVLIAATAIAHNAVLVTRNVEEFSRVSRLQVTDWY